MERPVFSNHLALFGTASDVGKSLLATAVCRLLSDQGLRVAPFKAQNMSNNAAVAHDGGEIGRAQYVQALAARIAPSVHHNPVLLKPTSERASQVVVRGEVHSTTQARDYFERSRMLGAIAFESLHALESKHEVLVLEGAGSCAEVNLRDREFVNFPAAHAARARVLLVADIERGGVFAQVVGSLDLMRPEDRARVCGVLINKFRGDPSLFDSGVRFLEERTGIPVLGVIPHLGGLDIDGEDSLNTPRGAMPGQTQGAVAVLAYPHLANFTDFDALGLEGIAVHFVRHQASLRGYAAVILPGSKAVGADLEWLRTTGLASQLAHYIETGGKVLGICGGMQMLGTHIDDPEHVEASEATFSGLGHLELRTLFQARKTVRRCRGALANDATKDVDGYEIHHGVSEHEYPALFDLQTMSEPGAPGHLDGVRTPQLWATYLHGLFDAPAFRHEFLRWALGERWQPQTHTHRTQALDIEIDRFAAHFRRNVRWSEIASWADAAPRPTSVSEPALPEVAAPEVVR